MKIYKYLFLVSIIFFAEKSPGQPHEIGMDIGIGKTITNDMSDLFLSPFEKEADNFQRIGFTYFYTPDSAVFSLKSGILFDIKHLNDISTNYLRIPLGIDFIFGKQLTFILGLGVYGSFLLTPQENVENLYYADNVSLFQFGVQYNTGLGLQITKKYNVSICYQKNFDLTYMYKENLSSPGGLPYTESFRGLDGFIKFGLKYKL